MAQPSPALTPDLAATLGRIALSGITREYPTYSGHVLLHAGDLRPTRELHPAFYGCFDWHSAVHAHWMLARLLRLYPDLPEAKKIRAVFEAHLTAKNLKAEADYFAQPNRASFERTYGWAWLLKLAEELHGWDDPDARRWSRNLRPLADTIVARYLAFLPK